MKVNFLDFRFLKTVGLKRFFALIVSFAFLLTCFQINVSGENSANDNIEAHKLKNRYSLYKVTDVDGEEYPYYLGYLKEGEEKGLKDAPTGSDFALDMKNGAIDGKAPIPFDESGFTWQDDIKSVTWTFNVETAGYYNIEASYTSVKAGSESPRRKIAVDGKILYEEMNNIIFDKLWYDAGEPVKNVIGDEVRPKQLERFEKRTIVLKDALGRYNDPLKVYLAEGEHAFTMTAILDPVTLHSIRFTSPQKIKTYSEKLTEYQSAGYKESKASIKIDGERPYEKNAISIRMETTNDPLADKSAIDGVVFNTIGGPNWREGNKAITWQFDVPESGLYRIDLRALQQYNDGLSSYRQIEINGEVPFEEFLCYEFPHSKWQTKSLNNASGEPFFIYLEKGFDQTITMSVKTSPYLPILLELETTLDVLSDIIRNVIMITGIKPDTQFDYQLNKRIPDLMDKLKLVSESLEVQIKILSNMADMKTSTVSGLEQIKYRIDQMIKEPFSIAKMIEYMIVDQTLLSSWISGFNNLALMIDFIKLEAPSAPLNNKNSNGFHYLWYMIKQFFASFFRDYSAVTLGSEGSDTQKPLEVWISRGKEWAEALDQIIGDDFTQKTGIPVKLNILPAGQLGVSGVILLSLASGTAPDVAIGTDSVTPVEYGLRDVILDLSKMPGYDDVKKQFLDGSMIPFGFNDSVYGLPETMDFTVMYCREDVMKSLGLGIPDTWDELYATILPELKRKGMDFWYEGSLYTFLFQQGGKLYSADGKSSALNSVEGIKAFKRFSDLYVTYQVPTLLNFYNHFRAGQTPLGISSFATYLQLHAAAPELEGKWKVYPIPGTLREDGVIDRSTMVTLTSSMIFKDTGMEKESWDFLKWYTSSEVQERYTNDLQAYIGSSAKWFSANVEAFDSLSWDSDFKSVVRTQRDWLQGIPNVMGGYISARHIENARVRTVITGENYRQSIEKAAEDITRELITKSEEMEMVNKSQADQ